MAWQARLPRVVSSLELFAHRFFDTMDDLKLEDASVCLLVAMLLIKPVPKVTVVNEVIQRALGLGPTGALWMPKCASQLSSPWSKGFNMLMLHVLTPRLFKGHQDHNPDLAELRGFWGVYVRQTVFWSCHPFVTPKCASWETIRGLVFGLPPWCSLPWNTYRLYERFLELLLTAEVRNSFRFLLKAFGRLSALTNC